MPFLCSSRRRFLRSSLGVLAAAGAPFLRAANSPLTLGFSLYGMKGLALPEALRLCSEIGYRDVELSLLPGYATEPSAFSTTARQELRGQLAERHLGCSALMLNLGLAGNDAAREKTLATLRAGCQFARELNADRPPLIETTLGGKADEWESLRDLFVERLHGWAEVCAEAQVTLAIKAHVNNAVNVPERLLWLLERVKSPAVGVTYDYSHFELAGLPLKESLQALLPHTRFVHVKDTIGEPAKFRFLLPGQGRTDYAAYFALLRELGYHGPVVVEVSAQIFNQPGYDPVAAARECFSALAPQLG